MTTAPSNSRRRICSSLAWLLLVWCPRAFALNPSLEINQYGHTAWTVRDGFFDSAILSIAQTPDGYIWLGTDSGLFRFDGVRKVPWQPPRGQQLPSAQIHALLAARDGTLWIGTSRGLASWNGNAFSLYSELAGRTVFRLVEDRDGIVWATLGYPPPGSLCEIKVATVKCYGTDGRFGEWASSLYEDHEDNLWLAAQRGVWRWTPKQPAFYSLPAQAAGPQAIAQRVDGGLLIAAGNRILQLSEGKVSTYSLPSAWQKSRLSSLLTDRDGGLWIGTTDQGLLHIHDGGFDVFSRADGLSGNFVNRLFEDREGNVWVSTTGGLDRFHDAAVATLSERQGLSVDDPWSVLAGRDGSVWVGTPYGVNRWMGGHVTVYRTQSGLPDNAVQSLLEDPSGRILVSTPTGASRLEEGVFNTLSAVPPGQFHAMALDEMGNLWVSRDEDLLHLRGRRLVEHIPWSTLHRKVPATAIISDPAKHGLWLGFFLEHGVTFLEADRPRTDHRASDSFGPDLVYHLRLDRDDRLWVATAGGLSRLAGGAIATLSTKNGLPCDTVLWSVEDNAKSIWLYTACGLVRMARTDLDAWGARIDAALADKIAIQIPVSVFDSSDGVRQALVSGYSPTVTQSADGKLWFLSYGGLGVLDPQHLPLNKVPPPVHIEQMTADRKIYNVGSHVRLPALVRDLQIEYTALSFVAPERVRFRYKLEGWDRDWQDVGNRRQAYYNSLPPRHYRFRVIASNNSGVWNEAGATLDFAIAPAYYQTTWFRMAAVLATLALLWVAYQLRVRQLAHQFDARLQERVNERTRIARELHDTLLQTFHGVMFRFQGVANVLPDRPLEAKQRLETALRQGTHAIRDGRDAIQALRASTTVTNDLAIALGTLGEELAADQMNDAFVQPPTVEVAVEGTPRDLRPIIRDDVYRIGSEALRNAMRHARARRIEVELRYDEREFQLRVRDDGGGIEAAALDGRREGHFGLAGMRERAELIGARFEIWSEAGMGTEVSLTIPSAAIYARPRS